MAKADRKHFGPAARGKSDGTGAMTELDTAEIPANMVLSNRDKSRHSDERGLDGRAVLTEQYQDHAANRRVENPDEVVQGDDAGSADMGEDRGGDAER